MPGIAGIDPGTGIEGKDIMVLDMERIALIMRPMKPDRQIPAQQIFETEEL
jgi:hypothetical protein